MGFSLSWLGVKGKAAEEIRKELGFSLTGRMGSYPKCKLSGAELPGGWYIIVRARESDVASDAALAKVSSGCEAVTCFVEDHVMFSRATGWKDGQQVWEISHESDAGVMDLKVKGEPPKDFAEIRSDALKEQLSDGGSESAFDLVYDVPAKIACSVAGFRHDSFSDNNFFELSSSKSSFWKKALGKQ